VVVTREQLAAAERAVLDGIRQVRAAVRERS
jgi:UDP-glucose 4-epimerase